MKIDVNVCGTEGLVDALQALTAALGNSGQLAVVKPTVTLEEVRARLVALSEAGKQAGVKALIEKYGATKLSDVPTDKYADLLREAEGI